MARMKFMNTEIDNLTMQETLQAIDQLIQEKKSAYVVTPNVDHIVQLETNKELQAVYKNASLILTDGKPLLWIANWYGTPIKEKISGSDLFPLLCKMMDGFEVLRTMNTNHTIEDVPVIMISSDDSEEAIRKAYELGASDYVNRPFDAKIVYRRVSNTIKLYAKQRRLVQMVSDQIRGREKNTDVLVVC